MIVVFAVLGLLVGAAINLLADQLPRWRRVSRAPFCPACREPRPLSTWSGLLAFGLLRRRCPHCGARLPWRHPLVELSTALLFAALYAAYQGSIYLLLYSLYSALFVLIVVIDMEHRLILNVVIFPAWALALLGSFLHFDEPFFWRRALIGGVLGYGLLWVVYIVGELFVRVMSRARGKDINAVAFGFGDVRLGGFIGLVLGFPPVLLAVFLAVLLGGLVGFIYWFLRAIILRRYSLFTPIPYGPFLVIGAMAMLFFGREITSWWLGN